VILPASCDIVVVGDHDDGFCPPGSDRRTVHDLTTFSISAPVGSSASKRTDSSKWPAMATRCCWPPKAAGIVSQAVFQTDTDQHLFCDPGSLLRRDARIDQGQLDIFKGVKPRQQLKGLKHKPDFMAADLSQFLFGKRTDGLAGQKDSPLVGVSRQPMMFIIVDLPEPKALNGYEFAFAY
jgi:hypothetical protein